MGRLLAQLVGTLLLVGLALHFIWWLVAGAVVVGGVWLSVRLRRQSIAATEKAKDSEGMLAPITESMLSTR